MYVIALILAIISGLIVLAGYFVPALAEAQQLLLNWATILVGAATIVGVSNLILVHGRRIQQRATGGVYSAILMVSLFATFVLGLMLGPDHSTMRAVVAALVIPAESSLMALLSVSLVVGAMTLLARRANLMGIVFLATAVLMLVSTSTLPFGEIGALTQFAGPWIRHVLALGGARGILIGVALGTLVTGLRVLIGTHRPYEGG